MRFFSVGLFLAVLALVSILGQPDGSAAALDKGDAVEVVLATGERIVGVLREERQDGYVIEIAGRRTFIARQDATAIERVEDGPRPPAPAPSPEPGPVRTDAEPAAPAPGPAVEPGADTAPAADQARIQALQRRLQAREYRSLITDIVEFLRQAPQHTPHLVGLLNDAVSGRLNELQYEVYRILKVQGCDAVESELGELLQLIYQAPELRDLEAAGFNRRDHLVRIAEVWSVSYLKRLDYLKESKSVAPEEKRRVLEELARLADSSSFYRTENLPDNAQVLYTLACIRAYEGDLDGARRALAQARAAAGADRLARDMDRLVAEVATGRVRTIWNEGAPLPPAPAPAPQATPVVAPDRMTAARQWVENAAAAGKEWFEQWQGALGWGAAAFAALWLLPNLVIRLQIRRGNLRAAMSKGTVTALGIVGYLVFLGHSVSAAVASRPESQGAPRKILTRRRAKASQQACSHCGQPVDLIEDYEADLRFDHCPHCQAAIDPVFDFSEYVQKQLDEMVRHAGENKRKRKRQKAKTEDALMASQTMARFLSALFTLAVRRRASDIHIERTEHGAGVQFRVDGMLADVLKVPPEVATAFLSAIKVQADLDITNHTSPQDGRYKLEADGVEFDVRINCAPTSALGEILFMRLLDKRNIQIKPGRLGFSGKNEEYFEQAIHKPHGLILVTGPTGSGKSTTLYVAMNQINTGERNIVTIEDPVEYRLPGLKQMQVNPLKKFTFATGLRSIVRQDPDVIMVGEIRDTETANMAVEASVTGHLVLTTLHTMDTATAVSRLADLGVSARRYSEALEIIIAQRLVRLNCAGCKQPHQPGDNDLERLGILKLRSSIKFMAGVGCPTCNYTGYYDRTAILEVLKPDDEMRVLLERETRPHVIREHARRKGMRLLREEGVMKIVEGQTTVEEVIRTTC